MSYIAVVLDRISQEQLTQAVLPLVPEGWETRGMKEPGLCHHMTVHFPTRGTVMPENISMGSRVKLKVTTLAEDDKVMAVGVDAFYELGPLKGFEVPSTNQHKHITVAISYKDGKRFGKPFQSNLLTVWKAAPPNLQIELTGVLQEEN